MDEWPSEKLATEGFGEGIGVFQVPVDNFQVFLIHNV